MTTITDNPALLDDWLRPLLQSMDPAPRRRLLLALVRDLRQANQGRIKAQQNPDGTSFAPRRPRDKKRGPMFPGMRKARWLKTAATPHQGTVGYRGRLAQIAEIHQQGLAERLGQHGPVYRYAQRRLLAIAPADQAAARQRLLLHLSAPY